MKTFEQIFCDRHGCDKWQFRNALFHRTLYRHAVPVAAIVLRPKRSLFTADFRLIEYVARATDMRRIEDEVNEFSNSPENRRWLRRIARVRISSGKLVRFAREYLPAESSATGARG